MIPQNYRILLLYERENLTGRLCREKIRKGCKYNILRHLASMPENFCEFIEMDLTQRNTIAKVLLYIKKYD